MVIIGVTQHAESFVVVVVIQHDVLLKQQKLFAGQIFLIGKQIIFGGEINNAKKNNFF